MSFIQMNLSHRESSLKTVLEISSKQNNPQIVHKYFEGISMTGKKKAFAKLGDLQGVAFNLTEAAEQAIYASNLYVSESTMAQNIRQLKGRLEGRKAPAKLLEGQWREV